MELDIIQALKDGAGILFPIGRSFFRHISNLYPYLFVLIFLTFVITTHILWERKKRWPSPSRLAVTNVISGFNLWMLVQSLFLLRYTTSHIFPFLHTYDLLLHILSDAVFLIWLVMLVRAPRILSGTDSRRKRLRDILLMSIVLIVGSWLPRYHYSLLSIKVSYFEDAFQFRGLVLPALLLLVAFRVRHGLEENHRQSENMDRLGATHVLMATCLMVLVALTWIHYAPANYSTQHGTYSAQYITSYLGETHLVCFRTVLMVFYNIFMLRLDLRMARVDQPEELYNRIGLTDDEQRIVILLCEGKKPGHVQHRLLFTRQQMQDHLYSIREKFGVEKDRDFVAIIRNEVAGKTGKHPDPEPKQPPEPDDSEN